MREQTETQRDEAEESGRQRETLIQTDGGGEGPRRWRGLD